MVAKKRAVDRDDFRIEASGFAIGKENEFQLVAQASLPQRRGGRGASSIVMRLAAVIKALAVLQRGLPPAEAGVIRLSRETVAALPLRDPIPYIAKWLAREAKRNGWAVDVGTAKDQTTGEKVVTLSGRIPGVA